MTKNDITPTEPVLAAIDISKHRHAALIEVPGKKRRRKMTLLNLALILVHKHLLHPNPGKLLEMSLE